MTLGDFRENNGAENFYQGALSTTEASFVSWGGKKESARATLPRVCYFVFMDTRQEPLRRREVSATKKGARNDLK